MKYLTGLLLVVLLTLTACGGGQPEATQPPSPTEAVAQATEPPPTEPPAPTPTPPAPTPTAPPAGTTATSGDAQPAACHTDPITSLLTLEKLPGIAPVTESEWQHGDNADAKITVIEYGDFQ